MTAIMNKTWSTSSIRSLLAVTELTGNCLFQYINEYCPQIDTRFFGLAGAEVASSTGRREAFLGRNRFNMPQSVIDGEM